MSIKTAVNSIANTTNGNQSPTQSWSQTLAIIAGTGLTLGFTFWLNVPSKKDIEIQFSRVPTFENVLTKDEADKRFDAVDKRFDSLEAQPQRSRSTAQR